MKRTFVGGFLMFSLAANLLAQQPIAQPTPAAKRDPAAAIATASNVNNTAIDHAPSACAPLKATCVAEPGTKVTITPLYSKVSEPLCFPKAALFSFAHSCDTGCANCEHHSRTKHYLVVQPCRQEHAVTVCRPVLAPACGPAPACNSAPALTVTAAPESAAPLPMRKAK